MDTKIKLDEVLFVKIVQVGGNDEFDMHVFFRDESQPFTFEAVGPKIPIARRFLQAFERRGATQRFTGVVGVTTFCAPDYTTQKETAAYRKIMAGALEKLFAVATAPEEEKEEENHDQQLSA